MEAACLTIAACTRASRILAVKIVIVVKTIHVPTSLGLNIRVANMIIAVGTITPIQLYSKVHTILGNFMILIKRFIQG